LKVEVAAKDDRFIELILKGEEHSFPNVLREIILEDKDVEFASYVIEHPEVGNPKLVVRTKTKKPETVIRNAIKKLEKRVGDFKSLLKKIKK